MRFQCIHCKGVVAIEDSDAGQAVACGHCERVVVVPATRLSSGVVINDFVIEKELGKGGVGTVYLARQISLDRAVALKVLHSRFSEDPEFIKDFIREARAAAQLNHPNIVQAYAVGEEEGIYFFAMEYIEGTTLKQVLSHSGRIVIDRALHIVQEVAAALDFAWTNQKLVHRDIKPDNIMLTESGRIKLADLGLARRASDISESEMQEVMGTPQYISPEQLLSMPLDCRSDIYSLGATLYHTVTGRFPFLGDDAMEIAKKHVSEPLVPPSAVVPDIAAQVSILIEVMMAKRPEHRYGDHASLLRDLATVLNGGFPQHPLSPDSQVPIDYSGGGGMGFGAADAMSTNTSKGGQAPSGRPGGKRVLIRAKGGGSPATKTLPGGVPAPVVTPPTASTPGRASKISFGGKRQAADENIAGAATVVGEDGAVAEPQLDENGLPIEAVAESAESAGGSTVSRRVRKPRKAGMSSKSMAILLGSAFLLALIGVGVLMYINNKKEKMTPFEKKVASFRDKYDESDVNAFLALVQMKNEDLPPADILTAAKPMLAKLPSGTELAAEIRALTEPFINKEVSIKRSAKYQEELKDWRAISRKLRLEAEEEKKRLEKVARDAEAATALAVQQAAEKEALEKRKAELRKQQDELRWQAVELCRKGDFDQAKQLFIPMSNTNVKEFADWAKQKQFCMEQGKLAVNLVLNTKEALKGTRVSLPNTRGKWAVLSIGTVNVNLENRQISTKTGEEVVTQKSIPFEEMPTATRVELLEKGWSKTGATGAGVDKNLVIAGYLLSKGFVDGMDECRKRLAECLKADDAAVMKTEADALEPVVKERQFDADYKDFNFSCNTGAMDEARVLAARMKAQAPDKYAKVEDEITKKLQGK